MNEPFAPYLDSGELEDSGSDGSALINNGTIVVQGANGKNTLAQLNANVTGLGTIVVENCFLWVSTASPFLGLGDASSALPFGMPISGFRAGDKIAITRQEDNETYTPVWDQDNQQLTILASKQYNLQVAVPLAIFMLEGTYGPNDFQVTSIQQPGTYLMVITTTNNSPRNP
jgi:hypothetical protein